MINVESLNSLEPNIEIIDVACKQDIITSSLIAINIKKKDLNIDQQTIYDNFMGLLESTKENEIINTPCMLSIARATSEIVNEGLTKKDYTIDLNITQQGYINEFVQLIVDLYK